MNIPNQLALSRALMAPLLFWVILNPQVFTDNNIHVTWNYFTAAVIFVLASVTDFFDGYIARELDQSTLLGQILDPLADKMLTIASFMALMVVGEASAWAVYIIIIRELFITGLRTLAVSKGIDVAASWSGKVKTVAQMFAIGFLLMHWTGGTELLWFCVALTLYSGFEYIYGIRKAFEQGESK